MAFPLTAITYLIFKFFKGTEIKGVTVSKRGLKFDNAHIVWGEGTTVANLMTEVDFDNSWNLGDYKEYARLHPELVIWEEELWWCPTPLRPCIRFFYFPWDRRSSPERTDEENNLESRDDLVKAVQLDADGVLAHLQNLRAENEAFRAQFGDPEHLPES